MALATRLDALNFALAGRDPSITTAVMTVVASSWSLVLIVKVLEGMAMGLTGVAIPALAATVMRGSGRSSAGFRAVLTAFGAGATPSPLIAGFAASFVILALIAVVGLVVCTMGRRRLGAGPFDQVDAC